MISFSCTCGKKYNVEDKYAGKKAKCKKCGKVIVVPKNVNSEPQTNESVVPQTNIFYWASCEDTELKLSEQTKNCPFCGETILERAKKCKHCGEMLNSGPMQQISVSQEAITGFPAMSISQPFKPRTKNSSFKTVICIGTLIVLGLIIGGIFGNKYYNEYQSIVAKEDGLIQNWITSIEPDISKAKTLSDSKKYEEAIQIYKSILLKDKPHTQHGQEKLQAIVSSVEESITSAEKQKERNNSLFKLKEYGINDETSQIVANKIEAWCSYMFSECCITKIQVTEITKSLQGHLLVKGNCTYLYDKFDSNGHTSDFSCVAVITGQERNNEHPSVFVEKFHDENTEMQSFSPDAQIQNLAEMIVKLILDSISDKTFSAFKDRAEKSIELMGRNLYAEYEKAEKEYHSNEYKFLDENQQNDILGKYNDLRHYRDSCYESIKWDTTIRLGQYIEKGGIGKYNPISFKIRGHYSVPEYCVEVLVIDSQKDKTGIWRFQFNRESETLILFDIHNDSGLKLSGGSNPINTFFYD